MRPRTKYVASPSDTDIHTQLWLLHYPGMANTSCKTGESNYCYSCELAAAIALPGTAESFVWKIPEFSVLFKMLTVLMINPNFWVTDHVWPKILAVM
jgi:hypothetical protein